MKNFLYVVGCILMLCAACEETKEMIPQQLQIENHNLSINFNDTVFTGATSDYVIQYSIEDPYIARIQNDYLVGKHVGETQLTVSSNGTTEMINVTVNSIYQLFEFYVEDYSNGKAYYKTNVKNLKYEDDTTLIFLQTNYDELVEYYLQVDFTSSNTTEGAILVFYIGQSSNAFETLIEHYSMYEYNDIGYMFINSDDISTATELAYLLLDRENQLCYIYFLPLEYQKQNLKKAPLTSIPEHLPHILQKPTF